MGTCDENKKGGGGLDIIKLINFDHFNHYSYLFLTLSVKF
jgi:hypothetical protein